MSENTVYVCFACGDTSSPLEEALNRKDARWEYALCEDCQNDSEDACDRCHSTTCDSTCTEGDALDEITDQQYQSGDEMEDAYWRDADEASDAAYPF